jgi:7-cyano-7-deazaguanine synthase
VRPGGVVTSIVLLSGGLDSAVLLALEAQAADVYPIYVSVGLAWERAEQAMLAALLASPLFHGRVRPLARVGFSMRDVYPPTHWAVRGVPPAYDTPDEDVYLAGRNLVLLAKAGVVAASVKAPRIVLGTLSNNPFPDATPEYFSTMARALSLGLNQPIEIDAPLAVMHKDDVIRLGQELRVPFEYTLSCMNPQQRQDTEQVQEVQEVQEVQLHHSGAGAPAAPRAPAAPVAPLAPLAPLAPGEEAIARAEAIVRALPLHCGLCSKCRERRDAFTAAGVVDPTPYAHASPR